MTTLSKDNQFYSLTPDVILSGVESTGLQCSGSILQLNSYENRVYEIHLESIDPRDSALESDHGSAPKSDSEDGQRNPGAISSSDLSSKLPSEKVIAKFYRPGRWSPAAILEEHTFLAHLESQGIPVIAPLSLGKGTDKKTLFSFEGLNLALFPKCYGRSVQELSFDELKSIGRLIARIHNVGQQDSFKHRPSFLPESYGWPTLEILESKIAPEVRDRYLDAAEQILEFLEELLEPQHFIRIHGDCHKGNLLRKDPLNQPKEFFFVDFDDCATGPAAQDLWMLLSGDQAEEEKEAILSGYEELRDFKPSEQKLFEPLRGLRIIHYAGWIARRWSDPSFPKLFPQFTSYNYWAEETEALEKIAWAL